MPCSWPVNKSECASVRVWRPLCGRLVVPFGLNDGSWADSSFNYPDSTVKLLPLQRSGHCALRFWAFHRSGRQEISDIL